MNSNPKGVAEDIGEKFGIGHTPLWLMQEKLERQTSLKHYETIGYPKNSLKEVLFHFDVKPTDEVTVIIEYDNGRLVGFRSDQESVESSLKRVYGGQNTSAIVFDSSERWLLSINERGGVAILKKEQG